jgi:large subunit ribosomal protein L34e
LKSLKKRERTVSRPYGGHYCANCVKNRIIRAFLVEEVKIVKKVMSNKK